MCFEVNARPPSPPDESAPPVGGSRLTLRSADGAEVMAFAAQAAEPTGAGVVILPDVRGLFGFYRALVEQYAAVGIDAVAIDYFARTAGPDIDRDSDWEFWPHVEQSRPADVQADIQAAVDHLRAAGRVRSVFTVGFCFGGGTSFYSAAGGHDLAGVIGYYGNPGGRDPWYPSSLAAVDRMQAPVLGLFGGADTGIPPESVGAFGTALTDAGVEHDLHSYPGAPHSFFDRTASDFAAECDDSWRRALSFIRERTAVG